jgi:RNA polymerase sigma factor (sigma-70 family)
MPGPTRHHPSDAAAIRDAFAAFYTRWHQTAWRSARAVCSCDADADDVVQQVFARLWRQGPERWSVIASPGAFIRKAAYREALAWRNGGGREVALDRRLKAVLPCPAPPPDRLREVRDSRARLIAMLAALPPRCRLAVRLTALEGLSHQAAAERMGVRVKAVEKQVARARRLLRERANAAHFRGRGGR